MVGHLGSDDRKLRLDNAWNADKPLLNMNGKTTLDETATLFDNKIITKLKSMPDTKLLILPTPG